MVLACCRGKSNLFLYGMKIFRVQRLCTLDQFSIDSGGCCGRRKPRVQYLLRDSIRCASETHRQHVRVVPHSSTLSSFGIPTESSSDPSDFVGSDRDPRSSPAEDNPLVCSSCADLHSHLFTDVRPPHRLSL